MLKIKFDTCSSHFEGFEWRTRSPAKSSETQTNMKDKYIPTEKLHKNLIT